MKLKAGWSVEQGDALAVLRTLPDGCFHTCATSPPYYGLRDYGVAGQIGLEPTPAEYVGRLVEVFREVRRVLRDDGTLWLNIGDSYNAYNGNRGRSTSFSAGVEDACPDLPGGYGLTCKTLKPKDLIGIPWMAAFALRADGWYLRSEIIWHKRAPMPESVTDRPTKAHEQVFLLTKAARYFYDADAVRETLASEPHAPGNHDPGKIQGTKEHQGGNSQFRDSSERTWGNPAGRNLRSVWTLSPEPYPDAHFATFPTKLVEPCIKAGTSEHGCCSTCGAPWRRARGRACESCGAFVRWQAKRCDGCGHVRDWKEGREVVPETLRDDWHSPGASVPQKPGGFVNNSVDAGWEPSCVCHLPPGLRADDLETLETPTGERNGEDPTMQTGRAGMNRPRGDNEGRRPITRYEQRQYAQQIRESPHRADMEREAGLAFAHYIRTDRSGARPLPPDLLAAWLERGWLACVELPQANPLPPVPCMVLDPFAGAGTTILVARRLGRRAVGIELNPEYAALARKRISDDLPLFNRTEEPLA